MIFDDKLLRAILFTDPNWEQLVKTLTGLMLITLIGCVNKAASSIVI